MKRLVVVALVVVVVFTGVPVLLGMPSVACADCDVGLLGGSCLLGILATMVGVAPVLFTLRLRAPSGVFADLLTASGLDRPPRLA